VKASSKIKWRETVPAARGTVHMIDPGLRERHACGDADFLTIS
jgi:hypothetical protein